MKGSIQARGSETLAEGAHFSWSRGFVILGFSILVVAAAWSLPPIGDEAYYWTWGRAPDWVYFDHPPGIAFVLAASQSILGLGVLGLRAPTVVSMLAVFVISGLSARRLCGSTEARDRVLWILFLSLLGAPVFALGYLPATPDPFQGVVVAFSAYVIVRALEQKAEVLWLFFAAFVPLLGILFKHSSALLALGAGLVLFRDRAQRGRVFRPVLYAGAFCGVLALLPWLVASSGFHISTAYQAERVFEEGTWRGMEAIPLMLGSMALSLGPMTTAALVGVVGLATFGRLGASESALCGGAALLLLACLVAVLCGSGEGHWPMPALVFVLPVIVARVAEASGRVRWWHERVGVVALVFVGALLSHVVHPWLPIPSKNDTTLDGIGFDEIAAMTARLAERHGAETIVTGSYQLASLMRYHTEDRYPVLELGTSRMSQYDLWQRPALCPGDKAIVVSTDPSLFGVAAWESILEEPTVRLERLRQGRVKSPRYLGVVRVVGRDAARYIGCQTSSDGPNAAKRSGGSLVFQQ